MEGFRYATYFDGKSSSPKNVTINYSFNVLKLEGIDEAFFAKWDIESCDIDSLNSGDDFILSFGDFPKQTLQFNANDYPALTDSILERQSKINQSYHLLNRYNPFQIVIASVLVIAITGLVYVQYFSPWVGEKAVALIPKSVEIQIGETAMNQFLLFGDVDTAKTETLQAFFEECAYSSNYDISTTYINGNMVNAFAAPGGKIVVYDEIIALTECYDELAGLLAHELAHVNQRHSMKILARSVSGYLVFSALTGDVAGASGIFLEQANQIGELSHSRSFEKEADKVGLNYMQEAGIDGNGMVKLFEHFMAYYEEELDSAGVTKVIGNIEFLSTHPSSQSRVKYLQEEVGRMEFKETQHQKLDSLWRELKDN